jgi:hypothetical protein
MTGYVVRVRRPASAADHPMALLRPLVHALRCALTYICPWQR